VKGNTQLNLGEKIRQIRDTKGLSIENMAYAVDSNKSTLSRIERGQASCPPDTLVIIRKFLDIEKAPLLEPELETYRSRLWVWHDMIAVKRIAEAKAIQSELSVILDLPYEHNLIGLYILMDAKLLANEGGNLPAIGQRLQEMTKYMDSACDDSLHLYHRVKGYYHGFLHELKLALKHSLLALDYAGDNAKPDSQLYYNIDNFYDWIGKPMKGIIYLERALLESNRDRASDEKTHINFGLALLYFKLGEDTKAKIILDACLTQARSINNAHFTNMSLGLLAEICAKKSAYDDALEYVNQGLKYAGDLQHLSFPLQYAKATLLQKLNKSSEYHKLMKQLRTLASGNDLYNFHLDTLQHLGTINDIASIEYLETVAVPKLRAGNGHYKYTALDICKQLEVIYKKKKAKTKALAIGVVMRDIYEDLFIGDVEFE